MKQSEKMDLLLKELYKYKHDGKFYSLAGFCHELGISYEPYNELVTLGHRLKSDGYIDVTFYPDAPYAKLNSYGIEYCEEDSYTYHGKAIINNNYNIIKNSPNAAIMAHSPHSSIKINDGEDIKRMIDDLKATVIDSALITGQSQVDIMECLDEISTSTDAGKKPRFALDKLIEITSGISDIGSFVIALRETVMK